MSDFRVEVSGADGTYMVAARSAAGEASPVPVLFPYDDLALRRQLDALELALLRSSATVRRLGPGEERPAQEFGRQLFEFVFQPELRALLFATYELAAQNDTPLQVRLQIGPPELAALPWEFLYDPSHDDYLCLRIPIVRELDIPGPRQPLTVNPPLRILAMIALAGDLDALDVDHERRRLTEAFAELQDAGRVELSWVDGQTWWDLQVALDQHHWHIFHFIGHGALDSDAGEAVLVFPAEDGGLQRIGASDLALPLAENRDLQLVVLNSSDTARASTTDQFSNMASVLIRRGIPAVVAMQYGIGEPAAITFARVLYSALAQQHPVDQAVTRARRAIKLARRHTLEWATPALYLRSATGVLFDVTEMSATSAPLLPLKPSAKLADQPQGDIARNSQAALVFLCHSSGDKEHVRALYRRLTADRIRCWFDEEDLLPGHNWEYEIGRAIERSRFVLACVSKASITKTGYLQKELKKALDVADEQPEGVAYLIPVRLEECDIPDRLHQWQWVDLFKDGGYERLLRGLRS